MARPSSRRNPEVITASAAIVDLSKPLEVRRQRAARRKYQDEAWDFYRTMPEIRYPANFTGGSLSRYRIRAALLDEDNPTATPTIPDAKNQPDFFKMACDAIDEVQGPQGDLSTLLGLYGLNMAVAGDGWLFGQDQREGGQVVATDWEFLSIKELLFDDTSTDARVYRNSDGTDDPINEEHLVPSTGVFYRRFWRPHPVYSALADTPMEALGDDCRRLQLLNESIEARLLSRLASNGIFFMPNSITMPVTMADAQVDEDDKIEDVVIRRLIAYMEATIRNRGSAAAALPIFMRGPDEMGEKIRHIVLDSSISETELKLRGETRDNIAMGLNLPREVQQGLSESNHWSSWSASDATQRNHLTPEAQRFADGLLRVYVRPRLVRQEVSVEDLRRLVLIADGAMAAAQPNQAEDGRQLHDRFAISDKALRERSGVAEGDKPSEEEYVQQIGRKINNPYLATWGMGVHKKVDWDKVAAVGSAPGRPGVGSTPTDRRPADPADPAGAPGGRGRAGGVPKSAGR